MSTYTKFKNEEKAKQYVLYAVLFLFSNLIVAFALGDVSFPSFPFSLDGVQYILTYKYYDGSLYYIVANLFAIFIFICIKTKNYNMIASTCFLSFMCGAIFFLLFYDPSKRDYAYNVYNFVLKNDIEDKRMCENNSVDFVFANTNKKFNTPNLCVKESLDYLLKDDAFIRGMFADLINKDNSFIKKISESRYCGFGGYPCFDESIIKNYKKIFLFIKEETSTSEWESFNTKLLNQFHGLKIGKGYNQETETLFWVENKTLKEKHIAKIDEGNLVKLRGFYFYELGAGDKVFVPIEKEIVEKIKATNNVRVR